MFRKLMMTSMLVSAFAAPAMAAELSKSDIEKIIHEYIMENPQLLVDAIAKMEGDKQAKADETSREELKKNADWLYKNKNHAEAGNPKGDVTVVEFFDYNCGYCKQALNDVLTLLDEDKNLRVVFVEIPILGPTSGTAAQWALAALRQDKYLPFHIALMRHKGTFNDSVLEDYAEKAGLNVEQLKKDAKDEKIAETIQENLDMASLLGITGTPGFIVGDNIVRGYVGLDGMRQGIKEARNAKK